ncbi:MAG: hypothetical protein ABR990_14600 [Terracidiphilus sp.]|jgi:hypothetical protein
MDEFSRNALIGLCFGFLWGILCSIAILYSIYLSAYRKAVKDSLKQVKPQRYTDVLDRILARQAEKLEAKKAKAAAKAEAPPL